MPKGVDGGRATARGRIAACALGLVLLQAQTALHAEDKGEPLWELGAGLGLLSFPPWIGSRQHDSFVTPMPYFVYRGERIQADRSGIRGVLVEHGAFEIQLSLAGTPPPDDREDATREDMPGLDPVVELGPELRWQLWEDRDERATLQLRVPVRAAISASGEGLDSVGWFSSPALAFNVHDWPAAGWKIGISTGPVFGDEEYHAYYYEVAPRYATATRPAYEADAGFGGLQWTTSVTRRHGNLWLGAFLRAQSLHGASFEDSPLVRQEGALAGGIAFAWVFARSEKRVHSRDD